MPNWSLVFLMSALSLGLMAIVLWVSGANYIGFTASATICAIASCIFSMHDIYTSG